ncbi:MAG TPA: hypothetical protein VJT31_20945 [Rugosimonospora sp.]|nr:hypothetical protein [Rugosimonospora sp.]
MRRIPRARRALTRLTWRVHLAALRLAGQGETSRLLAELCPRVYDPEPAQGEIDTRRSGRSAWRPVLKGV